MFLDPLHDETVGRQQSHRTAFLDGLKRSDPGIELLLGELYFQCSEASRPARRVHRRVRFHGSCFSLKAFVRETCVWEQVPVYIRIALLIHSLNSSRRY